LFSLTKEAIVLLKTSDWALNGSLNGLGPGQKNDLYGFTHPGPNKDEKIIICARENQSAVSKQAGIAKNGGF